MRVRVVVAGFVLMMSVAAAAAGCSSSGGGPVGGPTGGPVGGPTAAAPPPAGTPPASPADWPTYHRTNDRTGYLAGVASPRQLLPAWRAKLDGAVYGQPIAVGSTVVAATENDTVYGLDLASGRPVWSRHLGSPVPRSDLPCGDIDPLGITGTPAYDSHTGSVFVAAETTGGHHTLVALDLRTGRVRFTRGLDVVRRDRVAEQQRGALAVAGGRVYVPFGGLAGDCGDYVGYVAAAATDGTGPVASYAVPTGREGGIWAPPGPAVAANGDVYVAVGNGASLGGRYDGSDSVLRLGADLTTRISYFAPKNWGAENADDADLGSTGPVLLPGSLVLVSGKNAQVYLLDATNLGGIDGQLDAVADCRGFGGIAYARGAAYVPCAKGVLRVDLVGRTLRKAWQAPSPITGSPVVGGDAVYALDPAGGVLYALDAASGRPLTRAAVGTASRFSSPVLAGGRVLVGTNSGVSAVSVR